MPVDREEISQVRQATYYAKGLIEARYFLIDLPDVLAAGFVDHLRSLQRCYTAGTFPFSDIIAPKSETTESLILQPPSYARTPGFQFDLNSLRDPEKVSLREDLLISPGASEGLKAVKDLTTLDDGQAMALFDSLNRQLAFTQGPPGTGKTFLGVAASEVILKSQPQSVRKPIVVVCMTNHALDDFLESLIERNITKIARVGNRSACEWIEKYLLLNVSRRVRANNDERRDRWEILSQSETLCKLGMEWAEELSHEPGIRILQGYLAKQHPNIANQFDYLDKVSVREAEYHLLTRSSAGYAFRYWITGGDLDSIATLISTSTETQGAQMQQIDLKNHALVVQILNDFKTKVSTSSESWQHIWSLDLPARRELIADWLRNISEWSLCETFAEIHRRHSFARKRLRQSLQKSDARSLLEQKIDVIGLTATGCARNWKFLNMLQPHTFLMEEASELTEASTIAALVPSAEHLIKIGDPLQLRPQITVQALCKENDPRYKLDESLFERMMGTIPFSRLNTQRRAHPDLADLLRAGDYPYLIDHETTKDHPDVPGLASRLYWVDHNAPEDIPDPQSAMAKSFSNTFEVHFVSNTVKYLFERHAYRFNTITILTPYNGQVALFVKALKDVCTITLTKEDREALVDGGMLETEELDNKSATSVELGAMLRITTIDNYQGEENDVVFLSPVRSNPEGRVGFISNPNRINVAISRARNGFYIVGNGFLLENVPDWAPIVAAFKSKGAFGRGLPVLPCAKHCGVEGHGILMVTRPSGFQYISPCDEPCLGELPCGHPCRERCHPEEMHEDGRILCTAICGKTLGCRHTCPKGCYEKCYPCTSPVKREILNCGHILSPVCSTDITNFKCQHPKGQQLLDCRHLKTITCSEFGKDLICDQPCGRLLECGHKCPRKCWECTRDRGCAACVEKCGRDLPCGHWCAARCHSDANCPKCALPCRKGCRHGKCVLPCSVICDPCIEDGNQTSCPHHESAILCCLPGTFKPCSKVCNLTLSCGLHVCPRLCGEPCPRECPKCNNIREDGRFYTLPCQHSFPIQELDKRFGLTEIYHLDTDGAIIEPCVRILPDPAKLRCPSCESSIQGSPRYALAQQLLDGQDTIGRLCAKMGRKLRYFASDVLFAEGRLFLRIDELGGRLRAGPTAVRFNQDSINERIAELCEIQRDLTRTRDEIVQPVQDAITMFTTMINNSDLFVVPILSYRLRYERILYRIRFLIARFFYLLNAQLKKRGMSDEYVDLVMKVLSRNNSHVKQDIVALEAMALECEQMNLKRLQVELIIAKTSFVVLARNMSLETPIMVEDLKTASTLCAAFPDSAGCLIANLSDANRFIMSGVSAVNTDDMHKAESRHLWENLGKTDHGGPTYCKHKHPFNATIFTKGCPECGAERKL